MAIGTAAGFKIPNEAKIAEGGRGGGGTAIVRAPGDEPVVEPAPPEWVPANALFFMDFVNSLYWDGSAEVAIGALVGQNPSNWGPFNPATDIDETGIVSGSPILVGEALATAVAGCTMVFSFTVSLGGMSVEAIKSSNFSTDLYMQSGGVGESVMVKDFITNVSDTESPGPSEGLNKIAMTLSPTKLSASLNGDDIATCVATVPTAIDEVVFSGVVAIHSLTIYAQQEDAALPALSSL